MLISAVLFKDGVQRYDTKNIIARFSFLIGCLLVLISLTLQASDIAGSFYSAKNRLYKKVYPNQGQTFYLNCPWQKKKVDLAACGLANAFPKKHNRRAKRTEAEHVIPASWMYKRNNQFRPCYQQSKQHKQSAREYCQDHDDNYRQAHNDLVNLRPAIGQINAERSNKPFGETLSGSKQATYRTQDRTAQISSRIFIPDPSVRGDIARIAFYMADTYGVSYSSRQMQLFKAWHQQDPVSQAEMTLNQRIKTAQGYGNCYVLGN